jgi:predicted DNA binding CopG/RHH family protein
MKKTNPTIRDVLLLKQRATEEGMPYQTLIASVLHKFVTGQL